jgi:hypothetical protein
MMLTLTLAAGLLSAPGAQAEPQKGWVVEIREYTYHRQAKGEPKKGWIIELQWFTKPPKHPEKPKVWIIEWQLLQGKPQPEPVEAQYHEDLSAFIKQLKRQGAAVDAVEGIYVDDLSAYFKQLKKR